MSESIAENVIKPNNPSNSHRDTFPTRGITEEVAKKNTTVAVWNIPDNPNMPVVGWLVCVEGKNAGKDFKLYAKVNRIGRDPDSDVFIDEDDISRNHAKITYDALNNCFSFSPDRNSYPMYFVQPGEKSSYVMIDQSVPLPEYTLIMLGKTRYMFVPFCGEHFQWKFSAENGNRDEKHNGISGNFETFY